MHVSQRKWRWKRGIYAMLHPKRKNEAQREAPPLTPRSQRLETLQKQRIYTRSIAQRPALHCTEHSEPRQRRMQQPPLAQRGLLRFLCSISAHENRSADTRARSLCLERLVTIFGALGTPGKPNRDVPRNALLCSFLFLFYGTLVRSCAWPSFVFLCRMITLLY